MVPASEYNRPMHTLRYAFMYGGSGSQSNPIASGFRIRETEVEQKEQALHDFVQIQRMTEEMEEERRDRHPPLYSHDQGEDSTNLFGPSASNRPPPYERVDSRPSNQTCGGHHM